MSRNIELRAVAEAHFPHSPGAVWAFAARPENLERWIEGVSDVMRDDAGAPLEPGLGFTSRFHYKRMNVEVRYRVLEAAKPHRFVIEGDGPQQVLMTLEIARADGGSTVSYEVRSQTSKLSEVMLATVLRPLVIRGMRRQLGVELTMLRRALS